MQPGPAAERIMAVHTKPAEPSAERPPPKSVTAKPKEQPKKPPLNKRQLAARAAQAKPKQVRCNFCEFEDLLHCNLNQLFAYFLIVNARAAGDMEASDY